MTRSHFKILILLIGMAMMIQHIHVTGQSSCGIYMLSLLVSLPSTRQSCPPSQAASAITLTDTFTSNLAASMFAPGSQQLASEFNITKPIVATFTVTIYLLGFALGPVVIAPLRIRIVRSTMDLPLLQLLLFCIYFRLCAEQKCRDVHCLSVYLRVCSFRADECWRWHGGRCHFTGRARESHGTLLCWATPWTGIYLMFTIAESSPY